MLFDPKWEIKTDPFTLESLIAWLERQPSEKTYCYIEGGRCLLSQYFTAMGFDAVRVTPFSLNHSSGHRDLPPVFDDIAVGNRKVQSKWTFGAALERARTAQAA